MTWPSPRISHNNDLSIHQTFFGKVLYEHGDCKTVAAIAATSPLFGNSSLGPNLLALIRMDMGTLKLFSTFLEASPSSSFTTLQFTKKIQITDFANLQALVEGFISRLVNTKYFSRSLQLLELSAYDTKVVSLVNSFGRMENLKSLTLAVSCAKHIAPKNLLSLLPSLFPTLDSLNLAQCTGVTDDDVAGILKHYSLTLTCLNLSHASLLTDASLNLIASSSSSSTTTGLKLQTLRLGTCKKLTDEGIANFANKIENDFLTNLNIEDCPLLADASLVAISSKFRYLQELNLYNQKLFTDKSIVEGIAPNLIHLTTLNLCFCSQLTDSSLKALAASSIRHLKKLNLSGCHLISDEGCAR